MFKRLLNAGLRHEGGICHALGFQLVKHTTKHTTDINSHTHKSTRTYKNTKHERQNKSHNNRKKNTTKIFKDTQP